MGKEEVLGKVSGFIDKDTEIKGTIKFKNSFRIDGKFEGKIFSGNTLIVGEGGDVDADIEVDSISINGRVKGSIVAKQRAEIFSKGRVTGKVVAKTLIIEEGAFFQGSCQMELRSLENKEKNENNTVVEEKKSK